MAVLPADLKMFLSGGAANADPDASLGGIISTTELPAGLHNLFDLLDEVEANDGDIEYRCVYLKNDSAQSLINAIIFVTSNTPNPDSEIHIALGSSAINGTEQTVADEETAPTGVTFSLANGEGAALNIGTMAAGDTKALWVKRVLSATASAYSADTASLRFKGGTDV